MERVPMTPEGHAALKKELQELKAQMPAISKAIGEAMEEGDLKENAEYHAQKEKQGMVKARIDIVEDALARAEVIDPSQLGGDRVKFGARVTLENVDDGAEVVYRIVGSEEADIEAGTISVTSPVARALINREVGDEVRVKVPGGVRTYEIQAIDWK
jgi:transcription elongation factor GreA